MKEGDGEKLDEEDPLLLFISARTSNKDIHHANSHPHFTSSCSEHVSVCIAVTGNHLQCAGAEQMMMPSHILKKNNKNIEESSRRNCGNETLCLLSLDFVSAPTCSGISNLS